MSRIMLALLAALVLSPVAHAQAPLPGVDVKDLDGEEIGALGKLMSEGACPCDTQKSLLECITAKSCPAATELAGYGADKMRDGLGIEQVRQMVVAKYLEDHVKYSFDLADSPKKGAANPKIVIVEFADFECPHCALMRTILGDVVKQFPDTAALYFKQFPLSHHAHSHGAARAALAAGRQGRFWQMHDMLFQNQGNLGPQRFIEFATELGLNLERFKKDMEDPALYAQIDRDRKEAITANLSGTPTIYINGRLYIDEKTPEKITAYIKDRLAKDAAGKK